MNFTGKEGSACAEGVGEVAGFGEGSQREKTGEDDPSMHASFGSSASPCARPADETLP